MLVKWGLDVDLLNELVGHTKAAEIVNEVGGNRAGLDLVVWKPNRDGVFTTALAWDVIRVQNEEVSLMEWLWKKYLPNKAAVCIWKARFNCFPMDDRIRALGIPLASRCDFCVDSKVKTLDHIFSMGKLATKVWKRAKLVLGVQGMGSNSWWHRVVTWFSYVGKS